MYRYGFELEGFYRNPQTGQITAPTPAYHTDGFPGLVEFRTVGHSTLSDAFGKLIVGMTMGGYENFVYSQCSQASLSFRYEGPFSITHTFCS